MAVAEVGKFSWKIRVSRLPRLAFCQELGGSWSGYLFSRPLVPTWGYTAYRTHVELVNLALSEMPCPLRSGS